MRFYWLSCVVFSLTTVLYGDYDELAIKLFDKEKDCLTVAGGAAHGELGNGLFRSAAAISYALDHDYSFLVNLSYKKKYPHCFSRFRVFKPKNKLVNNQFLTYSRSINNPIPPNCVISGFPHSYLYFDHHKPEICELFKPSNEIISFLHKKYSKILTHQENYVGLHMRTFARRGCSDSALMYRDKKDVTYLRCSFEYYDQAINHFPEDSIFVVFSDNINCAKKLLSKYKRNFIFIEKNTVEQDFYFLSLFKRVITTNSTFSWWAAYLHSELNKEIVTPWPWFNHGNKGETWIVDGKHAICPPDWVEYSIGDSFADGFDDIIRKYLKHGR